MDWFRKLLVAGAVAIVLLGRMAGGAAAGPEGVEVENLPEWEMKNTAGDCTLLFSDSPEMVKSDGILYQDRVKGNVRLFFYHVNADVAAKKLEVILENSGPKPARITVGRYGLGGPAYDWMATGKEAQLAYFNCREPYELSIPPGKAASLAAGIGETALLPNMLINGIFDFVADHPVTVKVLMLPLGEDGAQFARTAGILTPDRYHLRGTFGGANRKLDAVKAYDPDEHGAVSVTLADNKVDRYLWGIDATNGKKVVNYGNYGVIYQISIPSKGDGRVSYYFAPRGGEYAGAIGIDHPEANWSPLAIPRGRLYFGGDKAEDFAFLGTFEPGGEMRFTFSPPGASNLPVKIVIIPQ